MGEVYQAHDTKLGRDVAIKVLPEAFAHDAERLSRFQREAKMLAALNHPNIATIHGLEQSGGTSYLVMELVSGETLQERVRRGPLPVGEALTIAKQIAEALEAAHEKSVIHRDLKPANVKVTPEGKVKVLDFGLAKAFEGDATSEDFGNSPTLSRAATMKGVILGTAAYMSPEQARGKSVDKRTDIWAFGCVLFELLTGKQAFHGEDITEILAAVVMKEPAFDALPANISPSIRVLLQRCLRKDRPQRIPDAAAIRIEIEDALSAPATAEPVAAAQGIRALGRRGLTISLGVLVLVAAITAVAIWNLKPAPAPQPVTRTVITLPPGDRLVGPDQPALALSPDGSHLAYAATRGSIAQLYLRSMDSLEARPISGTEGAYAPFFSPDGQWLGFMAGGILRKISVNGGAAVTLGGLVDPRGASWGNDGTIIFQSGSGPLQQVTDAGGAARQLTRVEKEESSHRWPDFLPSGQAVLFAGGTGGSSGNSKISAHTIGKGDRRDLIQGGTSPRYATSGHLIFAQGGTLMAVPFDPRKLEIKGTPVPIIEGVAQSTNTGATQYSISATGVLVYLSGGVRGAQRRLVWVNRNGAEQPLTAPGRDYDTPRLSPDGRRVAVEIEDQIWLYDLARDTLTRFTFEGNSNQNPAWTPDGKRIAFRSNREGPANLFWQLADGSGGLERLSTNQYAQIPRSWSPDGQLLAFHENNPVTQKDIWILRLSDRKAEPFLRTPFIEGSPAFSPDGHWLAYVSNESGRPEIYVQPYPGPGGKWQISTESGTEPAWNRNGRELFYRSGKKMMAVDVATQPSFIAGKPRVLFEGEYFVSQFPLTGTAYDVSPDGQRFLVVKEAEQATSITQINVVLNWFEELKQKVPTGKK
jgi:Tol biopolymer transport system component